MFTHRSLDRNSMLNCYRKLEEGNYQKQFGKRHDSMVLEPGDNVRLCKRNHMMDKDLNGEFIEQ